MPFMIPEYAYYEYGVFVVAFPERDDSSAVPADLCDSDVTGWFARRSDHAKWKGPFATLKEAQKHIVDSFRIDPYTGEDSPEKDKTP